MYLINKNASIYIKKASFFTKKNFCLKTTLYDLKTEPEPYPEP